MTAPVTLPPTGGDEAPCSDCIANKGLCDSHLREELPQLAEFPWRKWIGEPYVCVDPAHEDHVRCVLVNRPTPRGDCLCHNCSQKRWERARSLEAAADLSISTEQLAHQERKRATLQMKAAKAKKPQSPQQRLVANMHGARSRSRSSKSVAA